MGRSEEEAIDFKPFFDLVVGVLFILLILVAAQIFFSQWAPETAAHQNAAREAERRRTALELDASAFLDDLARRLASRGFTPAVDRLNLGLSVPAGELLTSGGRTNRDAAARFATALKEQMSCLSPEIDRAPDCRPAGIGRLARVIPRLSLAQAGADGTPDPQMRITALELAAAAFTAAPQLLAVRSPAGSLVMGSAIEVETGGAGPPGGRMELRVTFVDSGAALR
jgi:Tfp pilus assembly protein PilW